MTLTPGPLPEEQKILRAVALAYRRVMRAPTPRAETRADAARLAEKRQREALDAAIAGYRRLNRMQPATPLRYLESSTG